MVVEKIKSVSFKLLVLLLLYLNHMSNIGYGISCICPYCLVGQPLSVHLLVHLSSVCHAKNFDVGHYEQTFQQNSLIIAVIRIRHHWILSFYTTFSDLDLRWSHKVRAKQSLPAIFSHTFSKWLVWYFVVWWSSSSWTCWYYKSFWVRIIW